MTDQLAIDIAWTKPDPAAVKADGYSGVIGYISLDQSKDLSGPQAQAYVAAGLWVLYVWETTADRALAGSSAGVADAMQANAIADQRGYPDDCPLFVAVDTDAEWAQVDSYFQAWVISSKRQVLPYGGIKIVEGFFGVYGRDGWQTVAWSNGAVSLDASLYQRLQHTLPTIPGVSASSYDEDVVLQPLQEWGAPSSSEEDDMPNVQNLEPLAPGETTCIGLVPTGQGPYVGYTQLVSFSYDAVGTGSDNPLEVNLRVVYAAEGQAPGARGGEDFPAESSQSYLSVPKGRQAQAQLKVPDGITALSVENLGNNAGGAPVRPMVELYKAG